MSWNDRAQQRRQLLAAQIPGEWEISPDLTPETLSDGSGFPDTYNVLDSLDVQITRSTTGEILEHIKEQRWTSHRVMLAFCKRAVVAHQLTNCATNFLFTEALRIAQDHDAYLAKTGQVKGPLHGLPFSVKVSRLHSALMPLS
jgi:amidase